MKKYYANAKTIRSVSEKYGASFSAMIVESQLIEEGVVLEINEDYVEPPEPLTIIEDFTIVVKRPSPIIAAVWA